MPISLWRLCIGTSLALAGVTPVVADINRRHAPVTDTSRREHVASSPEWKNDLLDLHRHLIEIPSISGDEKSVADWLSDNLIRRGFDVVQVPIPSTRGANVRAVKKGHAHVDPVVMVTAHIDTVPPYIPYSFDAITNTVYGRGSVDAKSCVAAQIIAVENILATNPDAPIHLVFVTEEETAGTGMRHWSNHHFGTNYSHIVFGEPTWGKLAAGHKGLMMFRMNTTGQAAHSGYPWLGYSAVDMLVDAISNIRTAITGLASSNEFGNTTVNFGQIEGGVAANVVAEHATTHALFRLGQPDDFAHPENKTATERIRELVSQAVEPIRAAAHAHNSTLDLVWEPPSYSPVRTNSDVAGFDSVLVNYGTDVPNWTGSTGKRYLYGPGSIFVAHGPNEHVAVSDLVEAVGGYERIIRHALADLGFDSGKHHQRQHSHHQDL